jgi:hypothetical protein
MLEVVRAQAVERRDGQLVVGAPDHIRRHVGRIGGRGRLHPETARGRRVRTGGQPRPAELRRDPVDHALVGHPITLAHGPHSRGRQ